MIAGRCAQLDPMAALRAEIHVSGARIRPCGAHCRQRRACEAQARAGIVSFAPSARSVVRRASTLDGLLGAKVPIMFVLTEFQRQGLNSPDGYLGEGILDFIDSRCAT
jgi:hypothetical protein